MNRIRVLLVEDNPGDARLVQLALAERADAFQVEWAESLRAALERLGREEPDVVLLDLGLGETEGLGTLSAFLRAAPHVPIVVLTGLDDETTGMKAVVDGAQDYLIKGAIDGEVLARTIRYAIERHRLLDELRALDSAKSEFVLNAANELRAPLNALSDLATRISASAAAVGRPELEQSLAALNREAERIRQMITRLFDISQITEGAIRIDLEPVPVADVVRRALALAQPPPGYAVENGVGSGDAVLADPIRLAQALANLLHNAYQYGGTAVRIEAARDGGRIDIAVADNGSGVPAAAAASIFDPFTRGPNAAPRSGSGLGLAIVRRILEVLGGSVRLDRDYSQGARFVLRLPAAD